MPRLEFDRHDVPLEIRSAEVGTVIVSRRDIDGLMERVPVGPVAGAVMRRLCERPPSSQRRPQDAAGDRNPVVPFRRLTLAIDEVALHEHPWEDWLSSDEFDLNVQAIVRVSRVPARVGQATFTVPLRVLLCDSPEPERMQAELRALFGPRDPLRDRRVASAFHCGTITFNEMRGPTPVPLGWPVIDVLHLFRLPVVAAEGGLFSSSAEDRGSLGWMSQITHAWQVRLLVIDVADEATAATARMFGAAVVARGGPAVVVRHATLSLQALYERLVHDFPIDDAARLSSVDSAFVGGDREEIVRVSSPVVALQQLESRRRQQVPLLFERLLGRTQKSFRDREEDRLLRDLTVSRAGRSLDRLTTDYALWKFEFRESDGFVPMAQSLDAVRAVGARALARSRARIEQIEPRYVNGSLWRSDSAGRVRVDAKSERLRIRSTYELALQVGEKDDLIPVYLTSPFTEIPRSQGERGVWVELAVNGIGFEVLGDAVQDLFLPFDGPSDVVRFAVVPEVVGAPVLRYTIYYRQNVVQSYRLAALSGESVSMPEAAHAESLALLAAALHTDPERMPKGVTYVSRLEYEAAAITKTDGLRERKVSIVANDAAGDRVVTVKGKRFFFDNKVGAVNPLLQGARDELFEVSVNKITAARADWIARFGSNRARNADNLVQELPRLALAGWRMYHAVFSQRARAAMADELSEPDAKITVAHALLDDVVPWALMYDRQYTERVAPGSRLAVCTAALPDDQGRLPVRTCGQSPNCVLAQPGIDETNVACPLHFWGFRHRIEVPPKQVDDEPSSANSEEPVPTKKSAAARLVAMFNAGLASAKTHEQQLLDVALPSGAKVSWESIEVRPEELVKVLSDKELNLVYLYCHARGGVGDPVRTAPPKLEFADPGYKKTLQYSADEMSMIWSRKPIVIVNGCSTAAFTPDALSPFVRTFTRDCAAGGVVGTEIPVHEDLASEFGRLLISRLLEGREVGDALLAVRRELLATSNPIGLAYTLYAFDEYRLTS